MAPNNEIKLIKLYPAQVAIDTSAKRNNLLILSRRWGKTEYSIRKAKHAALTNVGHRVAWSAPTWKLMMETFEQFRESLAPATVRVSREDRRIELVNKSVIEFWSSDDTQAGRGRKYHIWISDESQRQRNLAKFIRGSVRPTLADYRGNLWVLGTANGEGSELHDFYLDCINDPAWFVAHGSLDQNPYIDPDEIATMRRDLGPELAAQELDSLWVRVDGITPLVRKMQWDALYGEAENLYWTKALAVDSSVSNDLTAIIGVWLEPVSGITYCDYSDIHLLEPDLLTGEIRYELLEELLWNKWVTGRYHVMAYDPYQMVSLAQRLQAKGVRTFKFTQNSMRLKADGYMRQLINEAKFRHPGHELLDEHMLNVTLKYQGDAFRFIKGTKSDKIDLAVALSMACWTLNETKTQATQRYTAAVAPANRQIQSPVSSLGQSANSQLLGKLLTESPWTVRS